MSEDSKAGPMPATVQTAGEWADAILAGPRAKEPVRDLIIAAFVGGMATQFAARVSSNAKTSASDVRTSDDAQAAPVPLADRNAGASASPSVPVARMAGNGPVAGMEVERDRRSETSPRNQPQCERCAATIVPQELTLCSACLKRERGSLDAKPRNDSTVAELVNPIVWAAWEKVHAAHKGEANAVTFACKAMAIEIVDAITALRDRRNDASTDGGPEGGDPPVGSRLWRCERELAKAREEIERYKNGLAHEQSQHARTAAHREAALSRSKATPETETPTCPGHTFVQDERACRICSPPKCIDPQPCGDCYACRERGAGRPEATPDPDAVYAQAVQDCMNALRAYSGRNDLAGWRITCERLCLDMMSLRRRESPSHGGGK